MHNSKKAICAALTTLFLLTSIAAPLAASGFGEPPYTVTVKYYDDVQITYTLNYPTGEFWSGAGDIPIGGTDISDQLYCVDPYVHFHSEADKTYWSNEYKATVDEKGGYEIAAPWTVSGAVLANNKALQWLVANGYRGDYLNDNDSVSRESVAHLNNIFYIGQTPAPINKKIALMATKVAIWKVLVGDKITIVKTSLKPDEKAIFDELVVKMVNSTKADRNPIYYSDITNFTISINSSKIFNGALDDFSECYVYGPLQIEAFLNNTRDKVTQQYIDKAFLSVNGLNSGEAKFVYAQGEGGDASPSGVPLQDGNLYGTNNNMFYLQSDDFSFTNDENFSKQFFLEINKEIIDNPNFDSDLLTVNVRAKAADIPVTQYTPLVYMFSYNGVHDWNNVQAYIGAAKEGTVVDLYAASLVQLEQDTFGSISVTKNIENAKTTDGDTKFKFQLFFFDENSVDVLIPVYLKYCTISYAQSVNYAEDQNYFTLCNGGTVYIEGLPSDRIYVVREVGAFDDNGGCSFVEYEDSPDIAITEGSTYSNTALYTPEPNDSPVFTMVGKPAAAAVAFTNKKIPAETPTEPGETPTEPVTQSPKAYLYVRKVAHNEYTDMFVTDENFYFRLEYLDTQDAQNIQDAQDMQEAQDIQDAQDTQDKQGAAENWKGVKLDDIFVSDRGVIVDGDEGVFSLQTLDMASFELDADTSYRVLELMSGQTVGTPVYYSTYAMRSNELTTDGNDVEGAYWESSKIYSLPDDIDDLVNIGGQFYYKSDVFVAKDGSYYNVLFTNFVIDFYDLTISKEVLYDDGETPLSDDDKDEEYKFQVVYHGVNGESENPQYLPLSIDGRVMTSTKYGSVKSSVIDVENLTDAKIVKENPDDEDEFDSVFILKSGESATIKAIPAGYYSIRELVGDNETKITGIGAVSGQAAGITVNDENETSKIGFDCDTKVTLVNTLKSPVVDDKDDGKKDDDKKDEDKKDDDKKDEDKNIPISTNKKPSNSKPSNYGALSITPLIPAAQAGGNADNDVVEVVVKEEETAQPDETANRRTRNRTPEYEEVLEGDIYSNLGDLGNPSDVPDATMNGEEDTVTTESVTEAVVISAPLEKVKAPKTDDPRDIAVNIAVLLLGALFTAAGFILLARKRSRA